MVEITEPAQEYLGQLLDKQNVDGIGVRIFVTQPGTPQAETCLAYCRPDEVVETDEKVDYGRFPAYIDKDSIPYLEEAVINFQEDRMGGQLTIKAPNAKMPQVGPDSPLPDRINYVLFTEINPGLAAHGGMVSLVDVVEDNVAILEFGGGCQGCAAVDVTLKQGVETTLQERIPELGGIRDATDHSYRENAYYK